MSTLENTVIVLVGKPGVGKFTIGSLLAQMTGARLVDNHSINNVLFNVLDVDGVTPLPREIWHQAGRVRAAVLDTIATIAPPQLSYIFTNYLIGEDKAEYAAFLQLAALAEGRGAPFVPVILHCRTEELVKRIVTTDRRVRMKLIDPVLGARINDEVPQFSTDHPNLLELDVSDRAPEDAAGVILDWVKRCSIEHGAPSAQ